LDPDTQAPTITLDAVTDTVAGTIALTATATDDRGVTGVQFLVDGASLGPEDVAAPYSVQWNTGGIADGPHSLAARARDAAGNVATSAPLGTTVANGPFPGPLRIIISTGGIHLDPDGYSVRLDSGTPQPVGIQDTVDFGVQNPGPHTLGLSGNKLNCPLVGSMVVQVLGPGLTTVRISVLCEPDQLLFRYGGTFKRIFETGAAASDLPNTGIQVFSDAKITWSPDARSVAFDQGSGGGQIHVMNLDGTDLRPLTAEAFAAYWPEWRGSGDTIYFTGNDGQGAKIRWLRLGAGQSTAITPDSIVAANGGSLSPDGSHVAFEGITPNSDFDIYRIGTDGSGILRLTTTPGTDARAAWSPDGTLIAFMSARQGSGLTRLYLMGTDGSNQIQLTPDSLIADYPAWSPDGLRIAFTAHNGDYQDGVWLINATGLGLQRIWHAPAVLLAGPPAWRPR
jgi:hypothetical protein